MATIKERLATLETKVKILMSIAGSHLVIDLFPVASAACVKVVENITKVL